MEEPSPKAIINGKDAFGVIAKMVTTPNLLKENKTLRGIILALAGTLGIMTGLLIYFV